MNTFAKLGMGAALVAALALAPVSVPAGEKSDGKPRIGRSHGPPSGYRGRVPGREFRGAPKGFERPASREREGPAAGPSRERQAAPAGKSASERHGTFRGRDYAQFTAEDRDHWRRGEWRHTSHDGRFGWWWFVGGFWYFYPQPIYPYPTYIGFYYEPGYDADYYWYWCDDPEGYYPYIEECYLPWVPVPPAY